LGAEAFRTPFLRNARQDIVSHTASKGTAASKVQWERESPPVPASDLRESIESRMIEYKMSPSGASRECRGGFLRRRMRLSKAKSSSRMAAEANE
jgi:hypothetical protein